MSMYLFILMSLKIINRAMNYTVKEIILLTTPPVLIKILRKFKKRRVKDSLSQTVVETYGLDYPDEFKSFEYMSIFKYYDTVLPRIVKITKLNKYKNLKLIDVGANIGDTVTLIRRELELPILAIEGDLSYFQYLLRNCKNLKDIESVNVFLGEKNEKISSKIKRVNGTGHLEKSESELEILTIDSLLDTYSNFIDAKFLKIDTDGYDNAILRGAKKYLAKSSPIIFMEYDPNFLEKQNDNGIKIFSELRSLGYQKALMYENFGEYMFSFNLNDEYFIEDMRDFFYKNNRIPYVDLCIFHEQDMDLFEIIRKEELYFYNKAKFNN